MQVETTTTSPEQTTANNQKTDDRVIAAAHSLWDMYPNASVTTYPSVDCAVISYDGDSNLFRTVVTEAMSGRDVNVEVSDGTAYAYV